MAEPKGGAMPKPRSMASRVDPGSVYETPSMSSCLLEVIGSLLFFVVLVVMVALLPVALAAPR